MAVDMTSVKLIADVQAAEIHKRSVYEPQHNLPTEQKLADLESDRQHDADQGHTTDTPRHQRLARWHANTRGFQRQATNCPRVELSNVSIISEHHLRRIKRLDTAVRDLSGDRRDFV